jgi:hypothetical protein
MWPVVAVVPMMPVPMVPRFGAALNGQRGDCGGGQGHRGFLKSRFGRCGDHFTSPLVGLSAAPIAAHIRWSRQPRRRFNEAQNFF